MSQNWRARALAQDSPARPLTTATTGGVPVILVTGATGKVGYRLLEALADAGTEATAMVRVEAKGDDLPGSAKHIVASFDEPPPAEVLQSFDRVFLLSPSHEDQAELEILFIDALVAAGHRPHVVKVAADGFQDPDCDVRAMRSHRQIAAHLTATGLPATYLAPSVYMETLLGAAETIREEGTIYAPAGQGKVGFIAASDVADVAAQVLTSPGHEGGTYVLTGAEALSYADVAARVSAVFAREVSYADLPEDRAREQLQASGLTPWQVAGTLELFDWIRHGGADSVAPDVRDVTGEDARPIEDWLSEFRGDFLNPSLDAPLPPF
jgi:NAD(P)H dehydrogenase (quinone)